jgi:dTDP-4-dehydrorhamnose 3,5-epimerase
VKFTETPLPGAFVIDIEPVEDERGFFARTFCRGEFEARGLNPNLVQCNVSHNRRKGTLRGMHYQIEPREEAKVVWCVVGAMHDVIVDLRPASPTFKRWYGLGLKAGAHRMLYVPEGFAHGFQTLEDDTVVFYQISAPYAAAYARGVRWDDPAIGITWPLRPTAISERDRNYALLSGQI